ncbi:hypothetical protein E4T56_gene10907 [Termitomyces sp. T112]|nr:hypothetical protein E4T56_gene10907 [Termitomyces sp. T112]KAH0581274.1 hypothetical protein H2248_012376 [Termitomyces sp. 'cryptogamus']
MHHIHISQLLSLPIELVSSILGFLGEVDLLTCTAVAKQLRNLILDSSKFQYVIELAKRRMICVIPASVTTPYASRLNFLRAREHAWRMLNWKSKYRLKIPPAGSIYEFIGDLYATGKEDDNQLTRSISFWELPLSGDANNEAELRSWTYSMKDLTIIDFTMDPTQDLLVLVALAPASSTHLYEIHLRSIATNEAHPRALISKLSCLSGSETHPTTRDQLGSVRIQISGDKVALLVKQVYSSSHLEIWDWVNNPQVSCKLKSKSGIEDFTFLSNDAFLIVRTMGSLETYTFPNPIIDSCNPVSQHKYLFPQLSDGYMYWYMTISSNSAPAFISNPRSCPGRSRSKQLYSPRPTERIYVCSLCVFEPAADDGQRARCFIFYFNPEILLHPPEKWKETTKRCKRRVPSCHYAPTSPSISTGPFSFVPLPIPHYTDITLQPLHSLPPPASTSAATSSATTSGPTTPAVSAPSHLFHAHSHPVLPESKPPKVVQPVRVSVVIPWHVWGPQNTRWFEEGGNTDWKYSVYGLRTVDSVRVESLPTSIGCQERNENGDKVMTLSAGPDDTDANKSESSVPPRFLRLRDYNPYSIRECLQLEELRRPQGRHGKGKAKTKWREPRVVTYPTTTDVKGAFRHDIVTRLPYVEVMSEETFRVTDVMMDDCKILLHERGQNGILKRVDVLMM